MEGCVSDEPLFVQALGDVLWTHELSFDVPNNDE